MFLFFQKQDEKMKNEYDILNSFTIIKKAIYSSALYFIVHLSIAMKFNNEYPYYTGCPTK